MSLDAKQDYIMSFEPLKSTTMETLQQTTTIESNKLIAEFMGASFSNVSNAFREDYAENGGLRTFAHYTEDNCHAKPLIQDLNNLQYHASWDWLMPVAAKCSVMAANEGWDEYDYCLQDAAGSFSIETLYNEVVDFIKWYNEQK